MLIMEKKKNDWSGTYEEKRKNEELFFDSEAVSDDEKRWATIAHLNIWFLWLQGFLLPFTALFTYWIYKTKGAESDFVRIHAKQALKAQLYAGIGWLFFLAFSIIIWVIGLVVTGIGMLTIVGIPVFIGWALLGALGILLVTFSPIIFLLFGTYSALQAGQGKMGRYPLMGRDNRYRERIVVFARNGATRISDLFDED